MYYIVNIIHTHTGSCCASQSKLWKYTLWRNSIFYLILKQYFPMPLYANVALLTPQILLHSKHAFKNKPSFVPLNVTQLWGPGFICLSDFSIILLLTPSCWVNYIKLAGIKNSIFDSVPFSSVLLFLWEPHVKSAWSELLDSCFIVRAL